MKKVILSFLSSLSICATISAQSDVDAGKKFLYYERYTSAKQSLQKAVTANPKDPQAVYWLGQAYIDADQLNDAKTLYQATLSAGVNDPLLWVGSGEIDVLQGGDINAAKQKFEQAITSSTTTKGKNKGPNPDVLNAIGKAMATGSSTKGDPNYGIDKLKQAAQIDPKNPDIYINLGLCYLKLGDHGGQAVEAFTQATQIDPQYAKGYYRNGKIYQSQRNKESMDEWYGKAIKADPNFAPVYLAYFNYYAETDVPAAKEKLDKYVATADKDCNTDYFVGDYLFRAGKYQESIQKAKEMEMGACKDFPALNLLYAYNYERLSEPPQGFVEIGDTKDKVIEKLGKDYTSSKTTTTTGSEELLIYNKYNASINIGTNGTVNYINVINAGQELTFNNASYNYDPKKSQEYINNARTYIQKYFAAAQSDQIRPTDYAFAGNVLAKFPESSDSAMVYLMKAVQLDTVKEEQKQFMVQASKIAAQSGNYGMILDILRSSEKINGGKLSETGYFDLSKNITDAAAADKTGAFDSTKYLMGDSVIQAYIIAYPDKPQGYSFRTRFAKITDRDTSRGLAINPIMQYNDFLVKDTAASSKKTMFTNDYYLLIFYAQYAKDLPKEQEYQKAIDITEKMKTIYTDPNSEEYKFADTTGKQLKGSLDKYQKSKTGGGGTAGKSQK